MRALFDSVDRWLKEPFQTGQSAWRWVLFVGLIIVGAFMWQLVLLHIVGATKEL